MHKIIVWGLVLFSFATSSLGVTKYRPPLFPTPEEVRAQIRFWEKVFYHFPSTTAVIHDSNGSNLIVDIVDFEKWAKKNRMNDMPEKATRDRVVRSYLERYSLAVKRFHRMGKNALQFGAIEKRVYEVFSRNQRTLRSLFTGNVTLRSQGGLADEFITAAHRAREYLPFMEDTFRHEGVPPQVTRLAFVESMFNLQAQSKVGASGIWQFMPNTARSYMLINRLVDERNSPFKATRGAARLLAENYRDLQSWPLAITAYNHGKGGMLRAVNQVGSRDLGMIIRNFDSPSFGFASRNFYAEFLAASRIYDKLLQERRVPSPRVVNPIVPLVLEQDLSVAQLLRHTPLIEEDLLTFNRCLRRTAFTKYRNQKLPKFFEIFLPKKIARKVASSLNSIRKHKHADAE